MSEQQKTDRQTVSAPNRYRFRKRALALAVAGVALAGCANKSGSADQAGVPSATTASEQAGRPQVELINERAKSASVEMAATIAAAAGSSENKATGEWVQEEGGTYTLKYSRTVDKVGTDGKVTGPAEVAYEVQVYNPDMGITQDNIEQVSIGVASLNPDGTYGTYDYSYMMNRDGGADEESDTWIIDIQEDGKPALHQALKASGEGEGSLQRVEQFQQIIELNNAVIDGSIADGQVPAQYPLPHN